MQSVRVNANASFSVKDLTAGVCRSILVRVESMEKRNRVRQPFSASLDACGARFCHFRPLDGIFPYENGTPLL